MKSWILQTLSEKSYWKAHITERLGLRRHSRKAPGNSRNSKTVPGITITREHLTRKYLSRFYCIQCPLLPRSELSRSPVLEWLLVPVAHKMHDNTQGIHGEDTASNSLSTYGAGALTGHSHKFLLA